jgi:prepilin peptidase CpaA
MLGAGDIKLFCAIGALIGLRDILFSIAYSFLFGFIVALMIMIVRKNFISRLKRIYIYLKSCFLNMSIMPYDELSANNDGKMHFTIPIALGTIMVSLF